MKRILLPLLLVILSVVPADAQRKNTGRGTVSRRVPVARPEPPKVFRFVSEEPQFNGDLNAYFVRNIHYPEYARENGDEGKVFVGFVVSGDGSTDSVRVRRSSGDIRLDREAVRVVSAMPHWRPGRINGRTVPCRMVIPVIFRLD
jgi:protein TonB